MRRRWVWFVFVPLVIAIGGFTMLVATSFLKALSFGRHDVLRLETAIAVRVTWIAFAAAALAWIAGWRARRRRDRDARTVFHEIASICLAVFFGGVMALARVKGIDVFRVLVPLLFLAWIASDARIPGKSPARRMIRALAAGSLGLGVSAFIHLMAR